jgi:hypothetical protein
MDVHQQQHRVRSHLRLLGLKGTHHMNIRALAEAVQEIIYWGSGQATVVWYESPEACVTYRNVHGVWGEIVSEPARTTEGIYASVSLRSGSMGTIRSEIVR